MAVVHTAKCSPQSVYRKRHNMLRTAMLLTAASAGLVIHSMSGHYCKEPQNNSSLTGPAWVQEITLGHPSRCRNNLGLNKHVFSKLLQELQARAGLVDSKYIQASEQLAIFLYLATTGLTNRKAQERFQRSAETISK